MKGETIMGKKIFALLMVGIMLCLACPALAAQPDYRTTEDFLAAMDEEGIKYTFEGTDSDKDEVVNVVYTSDVFGKATFKFYFDEDGSDVTVRVWNVIDYDASDRSAVLEACNQANYDYRYSRFYVDDTDNSVTMAYDAYLPVRNSGDTCLSILTMMRTILQVVYPDLEPYAK